MEEDREQLYYNKRKNEGGKKEVKDGGGIVHWKAHFHVHPCTSVHHLVRSSVSQAGSKTSRMNTIPLYVVIQLYAAVIAVAVLPVASFTPLIDIDKNAGPERSFDTYMHLVKRATVDNPLIIYFYKPNCHGPCEDFEHILAALASEKTRSMRRFTFAKAIGDASRSYPDGNPHSYKFLRPLNLHRLPAVRFFQKRKS